MELVDRLSTAVFLVFATFLIGIIVADSIAGAIRGTDLADFEAMRTTDPRSFRKIVGVCRWNGAIVVGLGVMLSVAGFATVVADLYGEPLELGTWLTGLSMFVPGVGLTWFALRWCRWAWRTKLD